MLDVAPRENDEFGMNSISIKWSNVFGHYASIGGGFRDVDRPHTLVHSVIYCQCVQKQESIM